MSLSVRIFLVLLAAVFFVLPSSIYAFDELNQNTIKEMLREPGVKLIAVDFYATWCEPCNKAIPKWKKLQEKYGSKGLKIVVISVQSGGSCAQPPNWTPDKIICDYEGEISNRWNAQSLPQAFLWSWQGNLLVANGQAEDVGKAIEQYFMKVPRVLVEEPADKMIYKLVRSELIKNSKMEILASEKEMAALRELSEKSHQMNYDEKLECVLGQEVSANSKLTISKQKRGSKEFLILELFSVEKGCLVASGISPVQGDIETVVARASYNLLRNLFGDVAMPGKKKGSSFQEGKIVENAGDWEVGQGDETIVNFESDPAGAVVIIDGKIKCQKTPCSKMITQGKHEISMQLENYVEQTKGTDVKKGTKIRYTLEPDFGYLTVKGKYEVELKLDGEKIGKTPITKRVINPGAHQIEHTDGCYYQSGEKFQIKRGEHRVIALDLKQKESAIKVTATDDKGNDVEAGVFIDDKKVGVAPGTFKVGLCSKEVLIKSRSGLYSKKLKLKEKEISNIKAVLVKAGDPRSEKMVVLSDCEEELSKDYSSDLLYIEEDVNINPSLSSRELKDSVRAGFKAYKKCDLLDALGFFQKSKEEILYNKTMKIISYLKEAYKSIDSGELDEANKYLSRALEEDIIIRERGYKELQFIKETHKSCSDKKFYFHSPKCPSVERDRTYEYSVITELIEHLMMQIYSK